MKKTFYISRKFDISRAPAGRLLGRFVEDRLRLENILILSTILGVVGLIAVQYLLWAALSSRILDDPTGPVAIIFWCGQIGAICGFLFAMLGGFSPSYEVEVTEDHLTIKSTENSLAIPWRLVEDFEIVDSNVYQKHYRRYKRTTMIGVLRSTTVVHMQIDGGPLFLALSESDLSKFERAAGSMVSVEGNLAISPVAV